MKKKTPTYFNVMDVRMLLGYYHFSHIVVSFISMQCLNADIPMYLVSSLTTWAHDPGVCSPILSNPNAKTGIGAS